MRNNLLGITIGVATCWFLIFTLGAASSQAEDRLLVLGDSWGAGVYTGLVKSFAKNSPSETVVTEAVPGETASRMNSLDLDYGLPAITSAIDMVQFSIGINDLLPNWSISTPPVELDALLTAITDDVKSIATNPTPEFAGFLF